MDHCEYCKNSLENRVGPLCFSLNPTEEISFCDIDCAQSWFIVNQDGIYTLGELTRFLNSLYVVPERREQYE